MSAQMLVARSNVESNRDRPAIDVRTIWLTVLLVAGLMPIFWLLGTEGNETVDRATWTLVVLSTIANVAVIAFHYTVPPHPKFLMLPWRRTVLRLHIIGGSIELLTSLVFFVTRSPTAALVQAGAALLLQIPTSAFQTPTVFGSKAVMVPAYSLAIVTHAFFAALLLFHPHSMSWSVKVYLTLNVYVWCRVYYFAFHQLRLFPQSRYTVAIMAAGATMVPGMFGALGFVLLAGFIFVSIVLYRWLFHLSPAEYTDLVREKARDAQVDRSLSVLFATGTADEQEQMARAAFDTLDVHHRQALGRAELEPALATWGLSPVVIDALLERAFAGGASISFDVFKSQLWAVRGLREKSARLARLRQPRSQRDTARFVFDQIDLDQDGRLSRLELMLLLPEWGLPVHEADQYLNLIDKDGDGFLTFEEFFRRMRPVWRYVFYDTLKDQDPLAEREGWGQSASARQAEREVELLRCRIREELLAHTPILAGADAALIADLAESLLLEEVPGDREICTEGCAGDKFYVVGRGAVRVTKAGETLAMIGVGGCFGEGALLSDEPRSATVTAVGDATLYSLTRSSFDFILGRSPAMRAQVHSIFRARQVAGIAHTLEKKLLAGVLFLKGADPALIAEMAASLEPVRFATSEALLREGDSGDRFYIVESGTVRIDRSGHLLGTVSEGACLGEGALLEGQPRSATATAVAPTRALMLSREAFTRILERHPGVRDSLAAIHRERQEMSARVADAAA